jgi:hypothetical protein
MHSSQPDAESAPTKVRTKRRFPRTEVELTLTGGLDKAPLYSTSLAARHHHGMSVSGFGFADSHYGLRASHHSWGRCAFGPVSPTHAA